MFNYLKRKYDFLFEIHDGKSKLDPLFYWSIKKAIRSQNLSSTFQKLKKILPSIANQYTNPDGMNCLDPNSNDFVPFYEFKVRAQHTFQIFFTEKIIRKYVAKKELTLIDIGDSSGNHIVYLNEILKDKYKINGISVNLDSIAIEKIKSEGKNAILSRAEELHKLNIYPDVAVSYEMLEHLLDPTSFLHNLSINKTTPLLIATVPFIRKSRFGALHIRYNIEDQLADPEDVHIFELNPDDWKLLAKFAGWKVIEEQIYYQYPRNIFTRFLGRFWRKYEYEGFYGMALVPDEKWSNLYSGW